MLSLSQQQNDFLFFARHCVNIAATGPIMSNSRQPHVAKCKRVIRPLVSKVHSIIDYQSKHSMMDFKSPMSCKPVISDPDSELSDDELYKAEFADEKWKLQKGLCNPTDSEQRLQALLPFIDEEVLRLYKETFVIFKNVISTFAESKGTKPLYLATMAAFKVGRIMAMNSKSTYYSINRAQLFDKEQLPPDIKELHDLLANDIDEWLTMEPAVISSTYRNELMIGYVLHFLVLNLHSGLYLLMPTLIHWLYEESKLRPKFALIKSTLFNEFWNFDYASRSRMNREERMVAGLIGDYTKFGYNTFWALQQTEDFWGFFFDQVQVTSRYEPSHASHFLDCLHKNNYLDRNRLGDLVDMNSVQSDVYCYIKMCPQHPNVNTILAITIGQIVKQFKASFESCKSPARYRTCIEKYFMECIEFTRVWLSFSGPTIFNSLYSGNEEMFEAVIKLGIYFHHKCSMILNHIRGQENTGTYSKEKDTFRSLKYQLKLFNSYLLLLRAFYLDLDPQVNVVVRPDDLVVVFKLCQDSRGPNKKPSKDFNDFISWLVDQNLVQIARHLFHAFYGKKSSYTNIEIDTVFKEVKRRNETVDEYLLDDLCLSI